MAKFRRGNLTSVPTNNGRNGLVHVKPTKKAKAAADAVSLDIAGALMDNLRCDAIDAPPHFNETEKALWDEVTGLMAEGGVLSLLDQQVLVAWVESWTYYAELREQVKALGVDCPPPLHTMMRGELNSFIKINAQLGLNPQARINFQCKLGVSQLNSIRLEQSADDNQEPAPPKF